ECRELFLSVLGGFERALGAGADPPAGVLGALGVGRDGWRRQLVLEIHRVRSRLSPGLQDLRARRATCALIRESTASYRELLGAPAGDGVAAAPEGHPRGAELVLASASLIPHTDADASFTDSICGGVCELVRRARAGAGLRRLPALLRLRAVCWRSHVRVCEERRQWEQIDRCARDALRDWAADPLCVETIQAVAYVLGVVVDIGDSSAIDLSADALAERLPALSGALSSSDQRVRRSALAIIGCHGPPLLQASGGAPSRPFEFFDSWRREVEGVQFSPNSSRTAQMVVSNLQILVENGRLPAHLHVPVAHCLVGGLSIPFAQLWPHVSTALSAMLSSRPNLVWP
ncbi:MAG: hypothetical protein VX463_08445, partial [Pseudomonadota bacterium]|nr:hypothetical protein [Pseudomonadota bacterium]